MAADRLSALLFSATTGGTRRSISAALTEAGVTLEAEDSGAFPDQHFGHDYEFSINIAAADLPRLAYALIVKHYAGRFGAVDEVRDVAEQAGIKSGFATW